MSGSTHQTDRASGKAAEQNSTNGAAHVYSLGRKAANLVAAGTYNTTDVLGFLVTASGTASWTLTFKDGGVMTVPQTALLVGQVYPFHLSAITSGAAGTAVLIIP